MWRARLTFQEVLPDLLPVYQRHGFCVLKIGEEGLVDLEHFATHTSRQRAFRKPRQHLEAAGYLRSVVSSASGRKASSFEMKRGMSNPLCRLEKPASPSWGE
jgi:lysylphosphatidylglycerol synthetase-like protein (DUF2156 family)